jgi:hypothetical protein
MKAPSKIWPRRISVRREHRAAARRLCSQSEFLFLPLEREAIQAVIENHLPALLRKFAKSETVPIPRNLSGSSGRITIGHCDLGAAVSILAGYPTFFGKIVLAAAIEQAIEKHYIPEIERAIKHRVSGSEPRQSDLGL